MSAYTLLLDAVGAADLPRVGGKGANLGDLARAGFAVPPGFCVTTEAFGRFMAGLDHDIYAHLDDLTPDDIEAHRRAGASVRASLDDVPLPDEVEDAIVAAWRELGEEQAYAVRSSATAEDLPGASFAGQQDSYLNVRGREALLTGVKHCFASLFTDRAILYRSQNGFDHREVALAVVVQHMVHAEVAGILFTADPVTNNRTLASIDASFGLGEALVSGVVSADLYRVDTRARRIVTRQIAAKPFAIRSVAEGGTTRVELSAEESRRPALTEAQALEIARLGGRIEAHFGQPQDVEWALADGTLYVTQSRPITSLYPLPEPRPDDDALHAYVSFSHFQVMTDALPPLALSMWRTLFPVGHADGRLESSVTFTAGGRLYTDVSPLLRHPLGRRIFPRAFMNADQLAAAALAELAGRPAFQARGSRLHPARLLRSALPYLLRTLRALLRASPDGVTREVSTRIDDHIAAVSARLASAPDLDAKLERITYELRHIFDLIATWAPSMAAGMLAMGLSHRLLKPVADPDDLSALGRGLEGNVTTEMDLAVGDLADAARSSAAVAAQLDRPDVPATARLAAVAELEGGRTFLQAWDAFLARYGSRGPSEFDLSRPRWSEDPSSLLAMIVGAMRHGEPGAHRARYRALVRDGTLARDRLVAAARRGSWGFLRAPVTRRLTRVARGLAPLREHHKFLVIRLLELVKPVLHEAGDRLASEGSLDASDDVWFLTFPEIHDALARPGTDLRRLVATRRAALARYRRLTPPRVMTSDGEIPAVKLDGAHAPADALVGSPVSAGVVEGVARVVLDPSTEILNPGEILVAPFTDPGWTPLFVSAAGLVTEVGGLMTHGSVVAREYGIPAVVGVVDATRRIRTGQRLRVHGDAGYIELLGPAAPASA